jgi:16S rRNA processing protein RimM
LKDRNKSASESKSAANGESTTGSPSLSSKKKAKSSAARRRRPSPPRTLFESAGPDPSTPLSEVRLTVGRIGGTHGVRGDVKMRLLTDDPENLLSIETVYLGDRDTPVTLENIRLTNEGAIIKLEGTETPEEGSLLSGLSVKISGADARPLEEGEYFLFQIIGLKAYLEDGSLFGTVVDLIETGAHDVLVIGERPDESGEVMVPNHPDFVPEIKPAEGRLVVRPPEWGN